jgi:hypothetical protein
VKQDEALWRFFREVRRAVEAGNRGLAEQPYRSGAFMVTALANDIELTVADASEEDAVLIAAELKEQGIHTLIRATAPCPKCGVRVPRQDYCVNCRARLR